MILSFIIFKNEKKIEKMIQVQNDSRNRVQGVQFTKKNSTGF